ncbi:MAG: DUF1571 domain-containing protein [Planctomycetota bacterium]|jgi:hypothetical protein
MARTVAKRFQIALVALSAACCGRACLPAEESAEPAEDHPLMPIVRLARDRLQAMNTAVGDYTCTLVKRERIDGLLLDYEYLFVKVRHRQVRNDRVVVPFSVYLRFLGPADLKGREVVYVEGKNKGQLIARRGGPRFDYVMTAIDPQGDLAMSRSHYPITEMGIKNLIERLLEVAEEDMQHGECEVNEFPDSKINGRSCRLVTVEHPVRRDHFRYHRARIFIDDQLQLPIRYEAYDWPKEEGGKPVLLEQYTFLDLKFNVGLTDWDFDHRNPQYEFREDFEP